MDLQDFLYSLARRNANDDITLKNMGKMASTKQQLKELKTQTICICIYIGMYCNILWTPFTDMVQVKSQHGQVIKPIMMCRMTYLSTQNLNGCTIKVWEWMSNFAPHVTRCMINYPCWDLNQYVLVIWDLDLQVRRSDWNRTMGYHYDSPRGLLTPFTVKPVYNDHLMGYFSAFWSTFRWPRAT